MSCVLFYYKVNDKPAFYKAIFRLSCNNVMPIFAVYCNGVRVRIYFTTPKVYSSNPKAYEVPLGVWLGSWLIG